MSQVFTHPLVELDAPPCIDLALRKDGDRLLVHLTNLSGMQIADNYTIIDHIPATGPITLTIRLDRTPVSVSLVPDDDPIDVVEIDNGIRVTVPDLHIHNVLVIEEREDL